jgi:hypothetical protein
MSRHQTRHVTIDATQLSMLLGGVALAGAKQRRKRLTIDGWRSNAIQHQLAFESAEIFSADWFFLAKWSEHFA